MPEAFEFLFHTFTNMVLQPKNRNGFRLLACDGSDLNIFRNPQDKNTFYQSTPSDKGFNQLHLNAFYDLCNHIYTARRQTKEIRSHPGEYKFMPSCKTFDYLPVGSKETYPIAFRVIRFLIGDNSYESIITNLPDGEFTPDKIKELYHMRWGIMPSFREVEYTIGLTSFHAKKPDYIKQEIYAKLILYNYCGFITNHVVIEKSKKTKHCYQVNSARAISICKKYLKSKELTATNVACLIQKNILPVRPGCHDPRKVKPQTAVGFLYRVA